MPTLVIKNPDESLQEQDIGAELTVGRGAGNGLVLSEGGVSRKHARFWVQDDGVWVEDLGSANGTWVDGQPIEGPTLLSIKSQVVIGDYEVQLKVGSKTLKRVERKHPQPSSRPTERQQPRVEAARPTRAIEKAKRDEGAPKALAKRSRAPLREPRGRRAASADTGPFLVGVSRPVVGQKFPLQGVILVGRVVAVDVELNDDSVSRRHAEIQVNGDRIVVRDLGSSNGTTVNGISVTDEVALAPGDLVQFGSVQLQFEAATASLAPLPLTGSPAREKRAPSSPPPSSRKPLVLALAAIAAVVIVATIGVLVMQPSAALRDSPNREPQPTQADSLEALLIECRTFSNLEGGARPDWAKANAACQGVLELEPIHPEANALVRRIDRLKACQQAYDEGREKIGAGQAEAGLESLALVGKDCESYLLGALSLAPEAIADVKKHAAQECRAYSASGKWELAAKRCEVYARLACQTMSPTDLYPPPNHRLVLEGRLNPKTDWRPSDPLYASFLRARQKLKVQEPEWRCPEIVAFRPPPPPPDPAKGVREELAARYAEPELGRALVMYFDGAFSEAPVVLQKILGSMSKAQAHEQARLLLGDINQAINLQDSGISEITNDRPDRAAPHFVKALEIDERLMLGAQAASLSPEQKRKKLEQRVSSIRRTITTTMAAKSYQNGVARAERKDFRAACQVWKLGIQFSRSNIDLSRALTNVCTPAAAKALAEAHSCEQLKAALDFAVPGDQLEEKIHQMAVEQGCP